MIAAALCFVWAGMVLGISFLETPVKFTAPSVTLPIGLDVGRHVFGMFNKVEIALALLTLGTFFFDRTPRGAWLPFLAVVAVVLLQSAWLLPILDARVELIFNGQTPPRASYHFVYVALEILKLTCLQVAGALCMKALRAT